MYVLYILDKVSKDVRENLNDLEFQNFMVLWVFVVIWLCFCLEEEVEGDVEEGVVSFLEIFIN